MLNAGQRSVADGLYRCKGLGYTTYLKKGEVAPDCGCGKCDNVWEFRASDNIGNHAIPLVFGRGIIHAIAVDELPEVGQRFNIHVPHENGLKSGLQQIAEVFQKEWPTKDGSAIWVRLEHVSDAYTPELPVHHASQLTC